MATSSSHKSSANNLGLPNSAGEKSERKMHNRVPPPPAPLNIPEPVDVRRIAQRPPSPLRNSYTADDDDSGDGSEDGSINQDDDDRPWSQRSHSPTPSLTKFASNIAQRIGALVGSSRSRNSDGLPTEAEIEAEAERERERSRREAEMIIKREEEERRMVEAGVLAMMKNASQVEPLTPPPARSQTMPSNSSSPSSSQKEKESWFSAVKNRLTPTKEPLTPAQQVIQETKAKDKERKKNKDKDKDKEWPSIPSRKYSDTAFMTLASSTSPEPITPPRPIGHNSPAMTPSPKRSVDSSRDAPPIYAQFSSQGTLDVPGTLLVVARRFEKLERWTVSHVRALEERMGDVERWLVEKEVEKETAPPSSTNSEKSSLHSDEEGNNDKENELREIRDEVVELQGRVGELGREMAKLMIAPLNLTSGPARNAVVSHSALTVPPTPTSMGPRSLPTIPLSTPRQMAPAPRPKEASPPPSAHASASVVSTGSSRTRLPYPTGDYTSPPGSIPTKQDILSPTNSPPSSLTEATRRRPLSISGLPSGSASLFQVSQPSSGLTTPGLPRRQESPPVRALSPKSATSALYSSAIHRQANVSPTPRKRYTVALGAPITGSGAVDPDEYDTRQRNVFSTSPVSTLDAITADEADSSDAYEEGDMEARAIGHSRDDTIGKSEARMVNPLTVPNPPTMPNDTLRRTNSTSPRSSPGTARTRAQSSYGTPSGFSMFSAASSASSSPTPVAPLRPRVRSKSIDRIGLGISAPNANGKFVDPLVIRRQELDALQPKSPKTPKYERGGGKVPVGELVAFFDKDKG